MDKPMRVPECSTEVYIQLAKEQRNKSQVFGIEDAERWSASKHLVDFLDDLLNEAKLPSAKYSTPVRICPGVNLK